MRTALNPDCQDDAQAEPCQAAEHAEKIEPGSSHRQGEDEVRPNRVTGKALLRFEPWVHANSLFTCPRTVAADFCAVLQGVTAIAARLHSFEIFPVIAFYSSEKAQVCLLPCECVVDLPLWFHCPTCGKAGWCAPCAMPNWINKSPVPALGISSKQIGDSR